MRGTNIWTLLLLPDITVVQPLFIESKKLKHNLEIKELDTQ